jgi:hypothetical protein
MTVAKSAVKIVDCAGFVAFIVTASRDLLYSGVSVRDELPALSHENMARV